MSKGKHPRQDRPVKITLSIPESVRSAADARLAGPKGSPPFGAWSKLITELLREWLRKEPKATRSYLGRLEEGPGPTSEAVPRKKTLHELDEDWE